MNLERMTVESSRESDATPRPEVSMRRWSKGDRIALGVLVVSLFAGLNWLVHPWYAPMNDASIYISCARAFLEGEGISYLNKPFLVRPPGFPLLISPVLATFGTNFYALNLYVAGFGCGTLVLLFLWVRPQLGALLALLVCYAVGLNPLFIKFCNQIMSDIPGTFFVLATLLIARGCESRPSLGREIWLGVCIGLSAYVRALNVMLLPAILLERAFRHARQSAPSQTFGKKWAPFASNRCAPLIAVTIIAFSPWAIRSQLTENEQPADQFLNYSYATSLFHVDRGDPHSPLISAHDWGVRIRWHGKQIAAALATRLLDRSPSLPRTAIAVVVLGIFFHWLVVCRSSAGFFVLFSLCVTVSYFGFLPRLLLPIYVLLVPALSEAIHQQVNRRFGTRWATGTVAVLLLTVTLVDFSPRQEWDEIEASHERMMRVTEALSRELPDDARLAAIRGFHYSMLMDRPVYSLQWASRIAPGLAGIAAVIDRNRIDHLLVDLKTEWRHEFEPMLVKKYGEGAWVAGVRIIRVRD